MRAFVQSRNVRSLFRCARTCSGAAIKFLDRSAPKQISEQLKQHNYAFEKHCLSPESLTAWAPFFADAKADPWGDGVVFKRSSYVMVTEDGDVQMLPPAPMTQSAEYNKSPQGGQVRVYEDLHPELTDRDDFKKIIREFSSVHELEPREPILLITIQARVEPYEAVDLNGDGHVTREEFEQKTSRKDFDEVDTDGDGLISKEEYLAATQSDPLTGQGCHRDGVQAVSVYVATRENCEGGDSDIYADHAAQHKLAGGPLEPGEAVHIRDLNVYHDVTPVSPIDHSQQMHRSVLVVAARFQDPWFYQNLVNHYEKLGCKVVRGVGQGEALFNALDTNGDGSLSLEEFAAGVQQDETLLLYLQDVAAAYRKMDADGDGKLSRKELETALAMFCSHPQNKDHYW